VSGSVIFILRILIALSLYAFLGWALWTLWRELSQQSRRVAGQQAPLLILAGEAEADLHRFSQPEVIIGRDPASDLYINDKTVSTQHARLSYHHRQWWLEDLDSTNGTFLNQDPVNTPVVIAPGDQVRCGQVVFNITIEDSSPA
jgi:hypothetical protein